jgi:DNA-directed RNA polymerase specialized sigma subunit
VDVALTVDQQRHVEANMGLVPFIHRKMMARMKQGGYSLSFQEFADDMHQEGYVGLIKAAVGFKASKGYTFATYAGQTIYNAMNRCIAFNKNGAVVVPFYRVVRDNPIHEYTSTDALDEGYCLDVVPVKLAEADKIARRLNYPYSHMVQWLYIDGRTATDLRSTLGMSLPRIKAVHEETLRYVRERLAS